MCLEASKAKVSNRTLGGFQSEENFLGRRKEKQSWMYRFCDMNLLFAEAKLRLFARCLKTLYRCYFPIKRQNRKMRFSLQIAEHLKPCVTQSQAAAVME